MPDLSIVIPYYRNPGILARQLRIWREEWPPGLKARCEIVLVDDGSPEPAVDVVRAEPDVGIPMSVYRVMIDIPWNQHGARNLGAYVATAPWLLLTDIDHVIPAHTLAEVLSIARKPRDRVYTFGRRDAPIGRPWTSDDWPTMAPTMNDRGELKPHVNSFAMMRETYWRAGGYDESYAGVYGTDRLFRDRLYSVARRKHLPDHPLIRVSRDVIPDASTTTLPRKEGRAAGAKKAVAAAKAQRGEVDKIVTLNFPWERAL